MLVLDNPLSVYKIPLACYHLECTGERDIAIPVLDREDIFSALGLILICTSGYN